ncbi:MFS transporter [Melaminivora sp.]|uniref:MFS transporter n=1 Tax=Melaminivora sp. TaxID=1933032 RepID=UPI0028AE79EB|nr:MFS transporter [Melaminivora sp.]
MSPGFRSLSLLSFAMVVGVMGTALISPLYGLYQEAWHLQTVEVSLIYVIYMGGALCALLLFGRLPDVLGFKTTMAWALAAIWLGTLVSMLAWNVMSLSVGRFIVGAASSMVTTSASLGFLHVAPPEKRNRMAMLSSILIAFGFGVGPLMGGILGQWAPKPLVTTYLPTLVLALLGIVGLRRVQVHPHDGAAALRRRARWADIVPRLTWPAAQDRGAFVLTCALPFVAFGVFGLYASMLPLFLDKMVPWHGPVVSGTAVALILFASSGFQLLARRVPVRWTGVAGLVALAASNALLLANLLAGSTLLFFSGVLLTALGHALTMLAGMTMINKIATAHNRSGLLSTYLVVGYIGSMAPMLGIGWIADRWGMNVALACFCSAVVAMGCVAGWLFQAHPRTRG